MRSGDPGRASKNCDGVHSVVSLIRSIAAFADQGDRSEADQEGATTFLLISDSSVPGRVTTGNNKSSSI